MNKLILTFCIVIFLIENGNAQRKLYRHLFTNEIFITGRTNKYIPDVLYGIGYEFSFNKNKTYFSLANEYSKQFSLSENIGDEFMSTLKVNFQKQHISSLGVGLKHTFNIKQSNIFLIGGYKYDFFKLKLVIAANILFEFNKGVKSTTNTGPVCTSNCNSDFIYIWHFGLSVGKYF